MNREIKFRAWDGKAMNELTILPLPTVACDTRGDAFMQFTGLKDKNGKEIYEGDILQYVVAGRKKARGTVVLHFWEVYWDGIKARWYSRRKGYELPSSIYAQAPTHEVIGNIFENPELLES